MASTCFSTLACASAACLQCLKALRKWGGVGFKVASQAMCGRNPEACVTFEQKARSDKSQSLMLYSSLKGVRSFASPFSQSTHPNNFPTILAMSLPVFRFPRPFKSLQILICVPFVLLSCVVRLDRMVWPCAQKRSGKSRPGCEI